MILKVPSSTTDPNAVHVTVSGEFTSASQKVTPVAADLLLIEDSADLFNKKFVEVGDLPGGGGGDDITVNSVAAADANFDDLTPAEPSSGVNVRWQKDGSTPNNVSAYVLVTTATQRGVIELATQSEVDTGTDTTRAITPATLASTTVSGIDSGAFHPSATNEIAALDLVTIAAGDHVLIEDSSDSNNKKRIDASSILADPDVITSAAVIPDNALVIGTGGARGTLGDVDITWDGDRLRMVWQSPGGLLNNTGMLLENDTAIINPGGWQTVIGSPGLFDGEWMFASDPTDTVSSLKMRLMPTNAVIFALGASVSENFAFRSEAAGALTFFMPQDTTGREETKISFVGEVGGTGHEGVFSIEGFAYGNAGLQFHRLFQCVIDADYTLHMDAYGRITVGNVTGLAAPVVAGDNASMGYSVANGLELTGQGTTNDVTIFNDTNTAVIEIPTGTTRTNHAGTVALVTGHFNLPVYTSAQLNDIADAVNTDDDKILGSMVMNSTLGHAVTAQSDTASGVWNDGVGTTVNTPVA